MITKLIKYSSLFLFFCLLASNTFSQCNGFTKKKCLPALKPYIHNGQMNTTTLVAGETAELLMTFYSNQEYRILVCSQEDLGNVEFRLLDNSRKVIFANKLHNNTNMWDFNMKSTQQVTVEVIAPPSNKPHNKSGCVSVLVGFKK